MKKLLALVLALAMVLSVSMSMAEGSKTTDDTTTVTTTERTNYTGAKDDETPKVLMWKINTTDAAKELTGKIAYTYPLVDETWFASDTKVPAANTVDATFAQDALKAMVSAGNITLVVLTEAAE